MDEPCRVPGCPGRYENETIEMARHLPDRAFALVTGIPARVCDFCGDTLLAPTTIAALDRLRHSPPPPRDYVPRYDFAEVVREDALPDGAITVGAATPTHAD